MSEKRETPLWRRYSRLWGADPVRDVDDELAFHFDMRMRDLVKAGMTEQEARERAAADFGSVTKVKAQMTEIGTRRMRNERRSHSVDGLVGDVRYAVRHFRRTPLATLTMMLVLSLGIGTSVVLFTVLNSLATMPAPGITRDESLVRIRGTMQMKNVQGTLGRLLSWPEVQEYAGRSELFSSVAAYATGSAAIVAGDASSAPASADVVYATPNYFSVLGVRAALGSEPAAGDDVTRLTTSPGAMISHTIWQEQYGGAPDVIGRSIRINDTPVEIVGVAPTRFIGAGGTGSETVWLPLAAYPLVEKHPASVFASSDSIFLQAAARLRSGVTLESATPVVAGIAARSYQPSAGDVATRVSDSEAAIGEAQSVAADVVPMRAMNHRVTDPSQRLISTAATAIFALLVLLITCTNVSALMVGLAVARRKEIGVRLSLGAPRKRLVRQLLTESILLAAVAAAVGLGATAAGIRVMGSMLEDVQLVIDWRVTLATCAIALLTGVLFGLSPALHATRVGVGEVLKASATAVAATKSRLQRALVVAQIALTQPLLVGLGVVIFSIVADTANRTTSHVPEQIAEVELEVWTGSMTAPEREARIAAVVERIGAMPGVLAALPMQFGSMTMPMTVHPEDRIDGITYAAEMQMQMSAAPKGYFEAYEIPVVHGRSFDDAEYAMPAGAITSLNGMEQAMLSLDAVVIGSDLARRLWGGANPLGRRLIMAGPNRTGAPGATLAVVGVVDEKAAGRGDVSDDRIRAFVPYSPTNTGVVVRTAGPAEPALDELRRIVTAEAPQMPLYRAETMAQREAALRRDLMRTSSAIAGGGLLALLLSAIGLYAVVSFAVGQRTREIGIRTALGARSGQVVGMFFLKGLALSAIGLLLGLPLSMLVTRLIVSTLNWPLTSSPLLGVGIGLIVLTVASIAVWIPSRRASRIDPLAALRAE